MHKDFVYINDVAPEIITDIRYPQPIISLAKLLLDMKKMSAS